MDAVVNSGTTPALDKTLAFLSARIEVIAENIANADTPGYHARQLSGAKFQQALARAVEKRDPTPGSPLRIGSSGEFREDANGRLTFRASVLPQDNILFHDGTHMRIEEQMRDLAETVMMHQVVVEFLRGNFEGANKAIRGRNI